MKNYLLKLFQYNAWANQRVIACLQRQGVNHAKTLTTAGHILAAQFVWLHRVKHLSPPELKLWGDYTSDELYTLSNTADQQWLEYIEATNNFQSELRYTNLLGDACVNTLEMILIHVVNHSSYHRGQITTLLREQGYEPVNTDFITYDRVVTGQLKN